MAETRLLLEEVQIRIRARHMSLRTEKTYLQWIRRFIRFHKRRHPREMGGREVEDFVTTLAVQNKVSASTQNQALAALLFLYRDVLEVDLPWLTDVIRAKKPQRLPVVLSRDEVLQVLKQLSRTECLLVSMLYGSGMRLGECLRLRVKDLELSRRELLLQRREGPEGPGDGVAGLTRAAIALAPGPGEAAI